MNIFVLDKNPILAAQYMCDKHVIKMILESAQLLCTAVNETGIQAPYRSTHLNHPCTVWTRKSISNWNWLFNHACELLKEYTFRYNKIHKTTEVVNWLAENKPELPKISLTTFVQAMPEQYRNKNIVKAYRNYYIGEKAYMAKWQKGRFEPSWWKK